MSLKRLSRARLAGLALGLLGLSGGPPGWATTARPAETVSVGRIEPGPFTPYPEHHITAETLARVISDERAKYSERMSLEQLQAVADAVTHYYREQGYRFHYAYLPPQQSDSGVVELSIVEVKLGDITVQNAGGHRDAQIQAVFAPWLGQPVHQPSIDQAMYLLKDQPGIDVSGYYSRGSAPGEVRLNARAGSSDMLQSWVHADNFGTESTGEKRAMLQLAWHNPTGGFDEVSLALLHSPGDDNTYGYLGYQHPLGRSLRHSVGASVSNNRFAVGEGEFSALGLDGKADIWQLHSTHVVMRSQSSKQQLRFTAASKATDYNSAVDDCSIEQDEQASVFGAYWSLQQQPMASARGQSLQLGVVGGDYRIDCLTVGDEQFMKGQLNWQGYYSFSPGDRPHWHQLVMNVNAQYSGGRLPSFEQTVLTGYYSVRTVKPGLFSADRGALTSLEWHVHNLFGNRYPRWLGSIDSFVYVDAGWGVKLDLADQVYGRAQLSGVGVGLRARLGKGFDLSLVAGDTLHDDVDDVTVVEDISLLMELNYKLL